MNEDDVDLQYLQCPGFQPGNFASFHRPRNAFEQRLAENLRPGLVLVLDLETVVRVLGGAALSATGQTFTLDLGLQTGHVEVVSRGRSMPSICADDAGNLLPALCWYRARGVQSLRVAVQSPNFFWLPLLVGPTGTLKPV